MSFITVDFETYYSSDFSLSKMTTWTLWAYPDMTVVIE